jgi:hypothetical protein
MKTGCTDLESEIGMEDLNRQRQHLQDTETVSKGQQESAEEGLGVTDKDSSRVASVDEENEHH